MRALLPAYLAALLLIVVVPDGGTGTALNDVTVGCLRLDYILHALLFIPLVPLWRLGYPDVPLWFVFSAGIVIAATMEGIQHMLPYRAFNILDLAGNLVGVGLGGVSAAILSYKLMIEKVSE